MLNFERSLCTDRSLFNWGLRHSHHPEGDGVTLPLTIEINTESVKNQGYSIILVWCNFTNTGL